MKPLSPNRREFLRLSAATLTGTVLGGWGMAELNGLEADAPERPAQDRVNVPPMTITTASGVRLHAIQTGSLSIRRTHRYMTGPESLRLPAILLDPTWTEPLPMLAWVIEHPEGLILIDVGEQAAASNPSRYLEREPGIAWFVAHHFRLWVNASEEIGPQLRSLQLDPNDVRWVVSTHLHFDHVGGLKHFPNAKCLVSKLEFERRPNGAAPSTWPAWYKPELIEYRNTNLETFPKSLALTKAGDVHLVPTPGHTDGHQSVIFNDGTRNYFFAGDAAFSQARLLKREVAGIVADVGATRQTLGRILGFAQARPTVFLPTHDPESMLRLQTQQTLFA